MPRVNDKACTALAKILADAKAGNVQLVGIIAVGDDGQPRALFAGEMDLTPSLNLGVDMLKATIMNQIVGHATAGPGVIRPGQ
jgi:hypothetical protein